MRFKSLKTNIALNLAILLALSIGLTDFVVIRIVENQMIENRLDAAKQWLFSLSAEDNLLPSTVYETGMLPGQNKWPNIVYFELRTENGHKSGYGLSESIFEKAVSEMNREVFSDGRAVHRFIGRTWGVFWMQSHYLATVVPLSSSKATATAVINLRPIYSSLRASQKIVGFYLLINFTILLAIGAYRLTHLVTRPIQRLIKLTDTYHSSDRFDLFSARQDDEFGRLSSALNRMLKRIERDKWILRQSLDSIESANAELKRAQQEIIRAEKLASTGRLSAGIAHEIGNPIGIVLGYLGLLKNRSLSPDTAADYIHRAETEINRINSIIRQLLDFSRPAPDNSRIFSLHDLLRDAGDMLMRQPLMKRIQINYAFSAATDKIFGDYNQLHQVLINLLLNSADSIAAGTERDSGRIDLMTRLQRPDHGADKPMLQLLVRDNGSGIAEENIDKVFDPFFTTKEPGKGTGLGLSVCYMIIERFGGTIEARSGNGSGATLVVHLPLAAGDEEVETCTKDSRKMT